MAKKIDKGDIIPFGAPFSIAEGQTNGLIIYSTGNTIFIEYTGMDSNNPRGLRFPRDTKVLRKFARTLNAIAKKYEPPKQ